jgi:hypothetical protein
MSAYQVLVWLGNISLLINIIFLLILRKRLTSTLRLVTVLLIGIFIIQISSYVLALNVESNQFLSHYYTIGQFFMLSIIFYGQLTKYRFIVPIGVALFSCLIIYQISCSSLSYYTFNTLGFLVSSCILMLYAMAYYIEHISTKRYWDMFNIGLFLYLGGSSIIFLTMNSWQDLKDWNYIIWSINASLFVVFQGFVMATIYRFKQSNDQHGISPL